MKLGTLTLDEPFGLYTLAMVKIDSQRNVNHYRDLKMERKGHSKNAMALITVLFLTAWTAISVYATAT
jgi:hypothetical protein